MVKLFILNLVGWLAWLSHIALAQLEFSEAVTGSASFPDVGIACLGNLAVFITSLLRGRLDLEIGARDVLATNRGPKLKDISGFGLSTRYAPDVIMLSNNMLHPSLTEFMKYIYHAHGVNSILLQCLPLKFAAVIAEVCGCGGVCGCIVFWTDEETTIMLARQMCGTLKRLSNALCLLPCLHCLRNGCHGCKQGLLHVENGRLTEGDSEVDPPAVCEILDIDPEFIWKERTCICIPLSGAGDDDWIKLLIRCLRSKDQVDREVRVLASDVLENFVTRSSRGYSTVVVEEYETASIIKEQYSTGSLIVPRFIEILVTIVLTGWLRVDGFSSSLVARRAVRDYVVDSKGTGFAANAFITSALVKCNANSTCQVLSFRGCLVGIRSLSLIVGCVNLICSISWAVLIGLEGSSSKWYGINSMPLSKPRVAVIMAAIGIALGMDCLHLYLIRREKLYLSRKRRLMVWGVIVLEIGSIVAGGSLGIKKGCGRWVYSLLQGLVWVKWGIGSYLLGDRDDQVEYDRLRHNGEPIYPQGVYVNFISNDISRVFSYGIMVYSSAFLLNAVLAGVRGKWEYSPS